MTIPPEPLKRKIVFMLPVLSSGGAERALITLMNNIDRDQFDPEIIVLDDRGPLKDLIADGIQFHSLERTRVRTAFFKLKAKLEELQPDIVMTTMVHSNFLLMSLKPFFPNTRFIIREAVIPSFILNHHKAFKTPIRLLYKLLYPKADIVFSPSQDIIDEFESVLGLNIKNHRLLYNQVDDNHLSAHIQTVSYPDVPADTLRFVCVGRLHRQKGYDRLINALRSDPLDKPWHLIILGEGDERHALEMQIKKAGLNDRIQLLGNVANPWQYMAAADCLLLPSRYEGMPNVVLEALACGTKVIAHSEANGVKEIQGHAGDVIAIADTMTDFIKAMQAVDPQTKTKTAPSLLPDVFSSKTIMQRFEGILLTA